MHLGVNLEVEFSLEYGYSVTRVATKMAWYSPCVIWIRGGKSASSNGGIILQVVGWVCVRGCFGCNFLNSV